MPSNLSIIQVGLAVQTFSRSVALSVQLLRELGVDGFGDSKATEEFILLIDELFDRLNCRMVNGLGTKAPLRNANIEELKDVIKRAEDLLLPMCNVEGEQVIQTQRRVGVIGLLCSAKSLLAIGEELLLYGECDFLLS